MESERWEQIGTLFFGALEREGDERISFLDSACAGKPVLREEIDAMLTAHEQSPGLLLEHRFLTDDALSPHHPDRLIGTHIGPYRICRLLGEGGMGLVFLAERDDEQYRQDVALKLIRPGLNTAEVVKRFRVERQILASLQHPNIARLLDGGVTEDGQPYLVMEFVEGTPITEYCDERQLTILQRLRLFATICRTVQFAHRNLVVHRDLKPTNILVADDGEVKLLDFGIAKLLDQDLSGFSMARTRSEIRVMTPEYGAPEQVRGEAITTATDVYALGALLYELLTGHRPYRLSDRRPSEVERIICNSAPTRPSTAVSRVEQLAGPDGTTISLTPEVVSMDRATQPARLRRTLRGDLDNIVLMALRKEPERRYASADQLAEDVDRYLSKQIVIARKDTFTYRAGTFVRRNRAGVSVAVGFVLVLIGFSVLTARQAQVVAKERDIARLERDRSERALLQAEEVSEFTMGMFEANDPEEARGDIITARELLERGVARAGELAGQPAVQARMLNVTGRMYQRLGEYDDAQPLLERAVNHWRVLEDTGELSRSLNHLGLLFIDRGRFADAEAVLREADSLQASLHPIAHPDRAETLHNLGGFALERGEFATADSLLRVAVDIRKGVFGYDHPQTVRTMRLQARALQKHGKYAEAESLLREILIQQRRWFGELHPEIAVTLNDLGFFLKEKGDWSSADSLYRESLEMRRALYGDVHPRIAVPLVNYAKLLMDRGSYDEAVAQLTEALSIFRAVYGPDHADVGWALENLARAYVWNGDHVSAISTFREALSLQVNTLGPTHPRVATTKISLASALLDEERYAEAEMLLMESLDANLEAFGEQNPHVASVHLHLGRLYQKLERFNASERHFRASVDVFRRTLPAGHLRTASALIGLGALLTDRGESALAEPLLREGLASRSAQLPDDSRLVVDAQRALDACLNALDRDAGSKPRREAVQAKVLHQ